MGKKEMNNNDTICALATAPGGALGIIRVSGPNALSIVGSVCRCSVETAPPNTIRYTHIVDGPELIDEAVVSIFRAPHSYTGEDSVEISCHGSRYILNRVLALLVENGCRMAQPGEYTMRAYLNGKLDLSQAEAVADLIASTNQATHRMAMSQLRGHFSSELKTLRDQLLQLTSLLELELDFSDHEELEFADRDELQQLAQHIDLRIQQLAKSFERGQALKAGIPVAIIGRTNVGKSTLLNQLVGDDRAIVSDIHGTTRDTIEEAIDINGIQFRFIDTAGIRNTTDTIEQIGIARTYAAIEKASIVLWLTDKAPSPSEVSDITQRCKDKSLIILHNKIDLERDGSLHASEEVTSDMHLYISAKTGLGIPALRQAIYTAANIPSFTENDVIVTNARHYDSLIRAHESILPVIEGLQNNLSSDLLSEDLRQTLSILSEITGGQITPQETLNNIFQHFCVGK